MAPRETMTPEEVLERMRAVIAEEREAILRFDAAGITRASDAKQRALRRLAELCADERRELYAKLDELAPALRCNLILLAHARAYIRDMQEELEREAANSALPLVRRKTG